MNRLRVVVMLVFLLVFGAGIGVGMVQSRIAASAAPVGDAAGPTGKPPGRDRGDHIADELGLSSEQREQMHAIWSGAMHEARKAYDAGADRARADREARIRALVPADQLVAYDAVEADHDRAMAELRAERKRVVDRCIQQTRAMLSPEQAAKYAAILDRFDRHHNKKNEQR